MYLLSGLLLSILVVCCHPQANQISTNILMRYPLMNQGFGEAGTYDTDLTMQSPTSVILLAMDKDSIVISKNVSRLALEKPEIPTFIYLPLSEESYNIYQSTEEDKAGQITIRLWHKGSFIRGIEHIEYVLGSEQETFQLAPIIATDPRDSDSFRCQNGAKSRLQVGRQARNLAFSGDAPLYESFDVSLNIIEPIVIVDIVAGPICVEAVAWWQIRLQDDTNSIAWTPEATSGGAYFWQPTQQLTEQNFDDCHIQLDSRIGEGAYIISLAGTSSLLYSSPDKNSEQITQLNDTRIFQVIEKPICVDNTLWWHVENSNYRGWLIEIENDIYKIKPSEKVILSEYLQSLNLQG